jgi:hypothetical protein
MKPLTKKIMITKKEIKVAIITDYYDDLDFIEDLNNITWARKVQLQKQLNQEKYGNTERVDK